MKDKRYVPMSREEFEVKLSSKRILGQNTNPQDEYLSYKDAIEIAIEMVHETRRIVRYHPSGISKWVDEKISTFITKSLKAAFGNRYYKKDYE